MLYLLGGCCVPRTHDTDYLSSVLDDEGSEAREAQILLWKFNDRCKNSSESLITTKDSNITWV